MSIYLYFRRIKQELNYGLEERSNIIPRPKESRKLLEQLNLRNQ
jgi:hypothetical protein